MLQVLLGKYEKSLRPKSRRALVHHIVEHVHSLLVRRGVLGKQIATYQVYVGASAVVGQILGVFVRLAKIHHRRVGIAKPLHHESLLRKDVGAYLGVAPSHVPAQLHGFRDEIVGIAEESPVNQNLRHKAERIGHAQRVVAHGGVAIALLEHADGVADVAGTRVGHSKNGSKPRLSRLVVALSDLHQSLLAVAVDVVLALGQTEVDGCGKGIVAEQAVVGGQLRSHAHGMVHLARRCFKLFGARHGIGKHHAYVALAHIAHNQAVRLLQPAQIFHTAGRLAHALHGVHRLRYSLAHDGHEAVHTHLARGAVVQKLVVELKRLVVVASLLRLGSLGVHLLDAVELALVV